MPSAGPALMKPSVKIILIFVPAYATILLFTQAIGVETTTTTAETQFKHPQKSL